MTAYEGWALVEQMGFRQTAGKVSEVAVYGTKMLRLDVPVFASIASKGDPQVLSKDSKSFVTLFCGGPSLYQVTPLDAETAIEIARKIQTTSDGRFERVMPAEMGRESE
jgi:hypothetical protein